MKHSTHDKAMTHNHEEQHGTDHSHHDDHHGHHDHGQMVEDFKKRFFVSIIITIPVLILSPLIQQFLSVDWRFTYDSYILFVLSSVIFFYGGWPFLKGAVDEAKEKNPGMMMLIGLAITIAYVYSVFVVFGFDGHNLFWELATLVDIMLLGHWIEMRSVMGASNALEKLVALLPNKANKLEDNGDIKEVPLDSLLEGDKVVVKPGEKIPIDGIILEGATTIDESMLTGESVPVEKEKGNEVIGGSINNEGSLTIQVEKTGEASYLSQVIQVVKEAQQSKSRTQDITNKAAKGLFYIAIFSGVITFVIWISFGFSFDTAIERMVTVMVITCPHALGLAAPLVVAVSTSLAAEKGLLIRNRANFELARKVDTVVFDKTGTLTEGKFGVTDMIPTDDMEEEQLLSWIASVEQHSEHPIANGIVNEARNRELSLMKVDNFESITGAGIEGMVDGKRILAVSPGYVKKQNVSFDEEKYESLAEEGKTVIFGILDGKLIGMIALADIVRSSANEAIHTLKERGVESIILTGDNHKVANWVAEQLEVEKVYAEVLPNEKAEKISEIKDENRKVAMTGDGVNDAPALATADIGIAIGAGTDIAMESADIVLVKSNPVDVVELLDLSNKTYKKMVQNLWWASGYNIAAIPLAAGVLAPVGIVLSPAVGAILMSLSTIIVAINAKLLK
ncbi:MAG TPA: cadmium-translocating P-type ATPase [Candidatus Pseudogracilibacillus intestinigallinarum]|uniref:P-type Cu(+) transporter n=1 Tax=Candidatus Pseudogracilibacillus intestinigallinarum TaxID=2838742 RepID=A0A9D1PNP6_9BACI|nr:cadmium-translocating P-type ATPase [Candidatus Pseudogracilibacillus intestinigallinarum]